MKKQVPTVTHKEIAERIKISAALNPRNISHVTGPVTGAIAADFARESGVSAYASLEMIDSTVSAFMGPFFKIHVSPEHEWSTAVRHWTVMVAGERVDKGFDGSNEKR